MRVLTAIFAACWLVGCVTAPPTPPPVLPPAASGPPITLGQPAKQPECLPKGYPVTDADEAEFAAALVVLESATQPGLDPIWKALGAYKNMRTANGIACNN